MLKLLYLVITRKVRFDQRTISFDEVFDKMKILKLKYFPDDDFISLCIEKDGSSKIKYKMYSNLPFTKYTNSSSLDKCFEQYEEHLSSGKTCEEEPSDKIKIEL